jgi:hypothetical protein
MPSRRRALMRGPLAAIGCVLVAAVAATGAAAAAPNLYVGDAENYAVAFKAEEGQLYVLGLGGTTECYYTEPRENLEPSGFSSFPAPTLMRQGPKRAVAEETAAGFTQIRASLEGGKVTGGFTYDESEESFHCDTGLFDVPFEARRYASVGSPGVAAPAKGERRVYYENADFLEVFLRTTGDVVAVRGAFVPECPVGAGGGPDQPPLFARPATVRRGEKGGFRKRVIRRGRGFEESITIAGRVERDVIRGTYRRARTRTGAKSDGQKCTTGPVAFAATRYLPVAPG